MRRLSAFRDIGLIIYSLLGLIPYLLAAYLATYFKAELPMTVLLVAVAALVSHLVGLSTINRFGGQLQKIDNDCAEAVTADQRKPVDVSEGVPKELSDLVNHFNVLIDDVVACDRNYRDMTTKLLLYTKEIEEYQDKLRGEALLQQQLSRYVSTTLVDKIMHSDRDLLLRNKRAEVTVLFADIRSFTSISENMPPEQVIGMLNEYFEAMTAIVFAYDGVLDKFVGDELMAVFGLTDSRDYGATAAVRAAMAMQQTVAMLMATFAAKELPAFKIGIGINTGEVVVGNVGSKNRMDYTVIGDVVNVASRLEQSAKGGSVVIGERTHQCCTPAVRTTLQGEIKVKNRTRPVRCYEVVDGPPSEADKRGG